MSFAISMEPINVMYTSASTLYSCIPAQADDPLRGNIEKSGCFSAHIRPRTQKKTGQRFQIKISGIARPGGAIKPVISAAANAITQTVFLRTNSIMLSVRLLFYGGDHTVSFDFDCAVREKYSAARRYPTVYHFYVG